MVPGTDRYAVSSTGLIYSYHVNRLLKPSVNNCGYHFVVVTGLYAFGKSYYGKAIMLHRLIALAFHGNPPVGCTDVDHLNNVRDDNNCENLEWVTRSENIKRSFERGDRVALSGDDHWLKGKSHSASTKRKMSKSKKGKNHPKCKGYYLIDGKKYYSAVAAAKVLGVSSRTVIRHGKSGKIDFIGLSDEPKKIFKYRAHTNYYETLKEIAKVQEVSIDFLKKQLANPKQNWLEEIK